jgi:hypothetical protein
MCGLRNSNDPPRSGAFKVAWLETELGYELDGELEANTIALFANININDWNSLRVTAIFGLTVRGDTTMFADDLGAYIPS